MRVRFDATSSRSGDVANLLLGPGCRWASEAAPTADSLPAWAGTLPTGQ